MSVEIQREREIKEEEEEEKGFGFFGFGFQYYEMNMLVNGTMGILLKNWAEGWWSRDTDGFHFLSHFLLDDAARIFHMYVCNIPVSSKLLAAFNNSNPLIVPLTSL